MAPLWTDLDPTTGGKIRARFAGDRFEVGWIAPPENQDDGTSSVMLVGISAGGFAGSYPVDLSQGSIYPDPLTAILPSANHEQFSSAHPFDLASSQLHRLHADADLGHELPEPGAAPRVRASNPGCREDYPAAHDPGSSGLDRHLGTRSA
ncbi:MAG: hypothetical protein KDB53_14535 [Planctomycetes bacterium]|nr:hypothetical protein [Planctomycetota bacterium]